MTEQFRKNRTQGSLPRRNRVHLTPLPELDEEALALARAAAGRVRGRELTIRRGFIRLPRDRDGDLPADQVPPVAVLLRGSRGGMRLKLYMAVLWMAGGGDTQRGHTVTFPARAYAELLGLDDPELKGQRRVREAFTTFANAGLLTLHARPGHPKTIALLREDGSGEPYDRPGKHFEKAADGADADPAEADNASVHHFVRLSPEFWTQGWAQVLSAPAIAVLLAMLVVTTNGTRSNQWIGQSERRLYGLSDDTWTKGTAELVERGILAVRRAPVSRDAFDWKRRRNTYTLILERLQRRPDADADADADAATAGPGEPVADSPAKAAPAARRPKRAAAARSRPKSTASRSAQA